MIKTGMFKYQVSACNEIGFKLLLFLALLLVTWQATSPLPEDHEAFINDKLGHLIVFFSLAFIVDHAFATTRFNLKKFAWLLVYGLAIEGLQYYVPSRQFSLLDVAANSTGTALYWLMFTTLIQRQLTPKQVHKQSGF